MIKFQSQKTSRISWKNPSASMFLRTFTFAGRSVTPTSHNVIPIVNSEWISISTFAFYLQRDRTKQISNDGDHGAGLRCCRIFQIITFVKTEHSIRASPTGEFNSWFDSASFFASMPDGWHPESMVTGLPQWTTRWAHGSHKHWILQRRDASKKPPPMKTISFTFGNFRSFGKGHADVGLRSKRQRVTESSSASRRVSMIQSTPCWVWSCMVGSEGWIRRVRFYLDVFSGYQGADKRSGTSLEDLCFGFACEFA